MPKTGEGLVSGSSSSVAPSTDLPVVNPDENSAKGRAGVFCPAGIENGLAGTSMLEVAIEKKITPSALFPALDGAIARRVWRSDPSMALRNTPFPITTARLY